MVPSQQLQSFLIPGGNYGYTGTQVDQLTSFENTLAVGLLDESGSTTGFARDMELCVKEIIKSLRHSPRADNLMYRHCHFGTNFREVHGYKPLAQINPDDYDNCYQPGGRTALYDSYDRVFTELIDYAEKQAAQKYLCNGVVYGISDGQDYGSTLGRKDVRLKLARAISSEALESLITILIGVNDDSQIQDDLQKFANEVGFTQYIPVAKADEKTLAKVANFVSQSISSQSQALGTGGPSKSLTF
jgi:uncharacterized protein YegL